ncbi:uncharacterized protein LOC126745488 [Anthonomus grandis grandis]|uniref:uncharacterized protein LOC126745488 n=1 Tax=Anthonomus grandis grandis TaxID=2921223 RepID=UPI002165BB37|nr:uncharacterized protein LOC126745488 [Anthonomus grandis grandis]
MSVKKRRNKRKKRRCVTVSRVKKKLTKKRSTNSTNLKSTKQQKSSENNQKQSKPQEKKITVQQLKIPCRRYKEFHDHFLTYDKIVKFLEKICKEYPSIIETILIGLTGEGKPIFMAKIHDASSTTSPKTATFIEAGAKGEDAFAVSNAVFMIDYFTRNPNTIKLMDYLIVPCTNPDAYDKYIKSKEQKNKCNLKRSTSKTNCCNLDEKKRRNNKNCQKPKCSDKDGFSDIVDYSVECGLSRSVLLGNQAQNKKADNKGNKPTRKESKTDNKKNINKNKTAYKNSPEKVDSFRADLSFNFPVVLGLNDMRNIATDKFMEQIKKWKENYINTSPEIRALLTAIQGFQFAIKMVISLQEGGQSICYPYGFCSGSTEEIEDLKGVAKKGKAAICGRDFEFGSAYQIKGLTYGNLIDFLKVDKAAIKYTYIIQVHKKGSNYNEKEEQKKLVTYGCQIMTCITRMTSAVYKSFCNLNYNKYLETSSDGKNRLEKKSSF